MIRGIYIDIFPIDAMANTEEYAFVNYKKFRKYTSSFEAKNTCVRKEPHGKKMLLLLHAN